MDFRDSCDPDNPLPSPPRTAGEGRGVVVVVEAPVEVVEEFVYCWRSDQWASETVATQTILSHLPQELQVVGGG